MRQRLVSITILVSLVGLPVGVTLGSEFLGEWVGVPALASLAAPAIAALAIEQHRHQKA